MNKTNIILTAISLATASITFAGSTTASCPMPSASQCFMMPAVQNSKASLTWIGTTCCVPAHNISADVSSLNSKQGVLTVGGATAKKIGTTVNVVSEKGGSFHLQEVEVTR